MAWLDDRIRDHPKIIRATPQAFRFWALALCYCSAHGTEGRLAEAVRALSIPKRYVGELVRLRLWDSEADGLWVHDWQEHNQKRDDAVEERRKQARERQRRHRDRVRQQTHPQRDGGVTVTRDVPRDVTRDVTRDTERDGPRGRAPTPPRDHDHDQEPRAVTTPRPDDEPSLDIREQPSDLTPLKINPAYLQEHIP